MEEDCGAFVADCVVLSCCCQCLVLQVTGFVFFKIPLKLARKMKKFVKRRRCGKALQAKMEEEEDVVKEEDRCGNVFDSKEGSSRFNCIEDIEGMLQELSVNEELVFGSFWRHEDSSDILLDVK